MLKCELQPGKLLIFFLLSDTVYSYIIFRVIIYVSPEKKLAVVRATQVMYTILYIVYNL